MPYTVPELRTVNVDRYVLPLREGGSVPGLVDADDGYQYVIKFRGSAQGPKVLIAELIGGEIARALGLKLPEIVFACLDEAFGRTENDEEIQAQLKASTGLNLGLHYLSGSINFDPNVKKIEPMLASRIVWLDALIMNMDRTVRNTNMLYWNRELWLIDHGASLFFHHSWAAPANQLALRPFTRIKDHVLLPSAAELDAADVASRAILTPGVVHAIVSMLPDDWLLTDAPFLSADEHRAAYEQFLLTRIENSAIFLNEARHAREEII